MCTAISYQGTSHYFGRNLDLEYSYDETVTVTPRNFPLPFRRAGLLEHHLAMVGMAYVYEGYPLYYDATNEKGVSMAGLNFPENACYCPAVAGKENVASFELIPWILSQCATLREVRSLIHRINVLDIGFDENLPPTPLHWIISDRTGSLTAECTRDGLRVWENPVGVLTNNPPFEMQMFRLNDYMALTSAPPENRFLPNVELKNYSRGLGAMGLPGDASSSSRFVRAAFARAHCLPGKSEGETVGQFFHMLDSVAQLRGCVRLNDGRCQFTRYSSCCNTDRGIYYYTTYENRQISAVDMYRANLDGSMPDSYPLICGQQIHMQN